MIGPRHGIRLESLRRIPRSEGTAMRWGLTALAAGLPVLARAAGVADARTETPRDFSPLVAAGAACVVAGWLIWLARRTWRRQLETGLPGNRLAPLLEHPDCLLWEAGVDISGGAWDWRFKVQPSGLARRIFEGHPPPWDSDLWNNLEVPERPAMDRRSREAIEAGRPGYEQRFRIIRPGRVLWVHESVSIKPAGPGRFWLVGLITDITAQQEAELARHASEERLNQLMTHANCMLWQAQVKRDAAGDFHWEWFVPRSELYRRIAGEDPNVQAKMPWGKLSVPEFEEIEARSRHAMQHNLPRYEQEFRVINGAEVLWMHEQAVITPLGPDHWKLNGVVIDITAQRRAEEAQHASEKRLTQLLERADCMLWQGRVNRQPDDSLQWSIYLPQSQLYRRIYGRDPQAGPVFRWAEMGVPEFAEMTKNARQALFSGANGYQQTFHIPKPAGDFWLTEQVSISPAGPDTWDLVGIITDISARHEAEEARRATEAQLRQILELADCMVWEATVTVNPDDSLTWALYTPRSLLYRRIFGEDSTETNLNWMKINVPEFPEMRLRSQAAVKSHATGYSQEFHVIQPQQVIWLQEVVTIHPLPSGQVRMVGVITDISARRSAEQAVRASEVRYRSLFQHTPVGIMETDFTAVGVWLDELRRTGVVDLAGWLDQDARRLDQAVGLVRVTDTNETARQVLRAPKVDHFAARPDVLGTPDAWRVIRAALLALWSGHNTHEEQLDMRDREGAVHHMNVRWWTAQHERGLDLSQSVLVFVDLTDLKQAEAALAAEKERLAVTLRAMAEGVITIDVDGTVLFINPAAAGLTQWEGTAAIGRPVAEICAFAHQRTGVPVSLTRRAGVTELPPKTCLTARDGTRRLVEGCWAPIHAADSRVIGTVLVFRDVTEQDRLEEELVRATRLESIGILAGGIAHDFNNILTAVMGNLALALLDVEGGTPVADSLRAAETATLRARDLTQQLLTFAKGGEPVRAAVALEAIVREVTAFTLHGSQVKVAYDFPADLWPVDADKGQISRVVQNLVINAVQAMTAGGRLGVGASNERLSGAGRPGLSAGDFVRIAITDTGEGINPEHLARIFDPYFTTKAGGSGLGLAAVYSIVKKHQGHIEVDSQPGQGTTFHIWLPALRHGSVPPMAPAAVPVRRLQGRVLFMDDEEIIREMAEKMLALFGLEVECAAEGMEAVDKYRRALAAGRPFDVIVMDLTIPGGMGGLATLGRLRQLDPGVRAIVSSGYSSDPVMANYRAHGFCGMVAKPYEINDFAAVVGAALADAVGR